MVRGMTESDFLQHILEAPQEAAMTWKVLADWLEERGDPRFELVRLCHDPNYLPQLPDAARDERVERLLESGLAPCVPTLVNSIGMRLALIPAGAFLLGDPTLQETPEQNRVQMVVLTRPFLMGVYPVTQAEFEQVMGHNPSRFRTGQRAGQPLYRVDTSRFPVDSANFADAQTFCRRLSALEAERAAGRVYRLPTDAEWERACRGGARTSRAFHFGMSASSRQANFDGSAPFGMAAPGPCLRRTCQVGQYPPNAYGLHDMHGNVWEWCQDWCSEVPLQPSPVTNPRGPRRGTTRVCRGGSYFNPASRCRSAYRIGYYPGGHNDFIGFRVVCSLPKLPRR